MTEVSDWKKIDKENTAIDDLTLSAPQGSYWQKMMGAIARMYQNCKLAKVASSKDLDYIKVAKVADGTPTTYPWETAGQSAEIALPAIGEGKTVLRFVAHDGIDVSIDETNYLNTGDDRKEISVHLRLTPTGGE